MRETASVMSRRRAGVPAGFDDSADQQEADGIGTRVEPQVVLPAQCFERRAATLQPEKRLMLAVLEDAVATALKYGYARRVAEPQAMSELEDWFSSEDERCPFAFVRICEALDLDAGCIRAGLARARQARGLVSKKAPACPLRRMVVGTRNVISGR